MMKPILTFFILLLFFGLLIFCKAQQNGIPQGSNQGISQMSVGITTAPQDLTRSMLLSVRGTPAAISQQDLDVMAETLKNAYKQEQDIACGRGQNPNPNHRLNAMSAAILPNEIIGYGSEPRVVQASVDFSLFLQFDFVCKGCQATGYDLFDPTGDPSMMVMSRDAYEVPFPSSLYIKPCVPTHQEVSSNYIGSVMSMNIPGVEMVYNVDALRLGTDDCDDDPALGSKFESHLTIAFHGDTSIPDLSDQLAVVEQIFITTYNELNVLNPYNCDPYSRILHNATVVLHDPQNATEPRVNARRRLKRIGYNWKFFEIFTGGSCYGCPTDACLTNDISGYATCENSRRRGRRQLLSEGGSDSFDSCYCTAEGVNGPALPTNEDLLLALEEQFEILRNETNFTLVESIVYLIEVDVPDSCCGWPVNGNIPVDVDRNDFRSAIVSYLDTGSSPYGSPISCWDVSSVTDMSYSFDNKVDFNEPLICWDTSKVTTMKRMFFKASSFNHDLSFWDTNQVSDMVQMFQQATKFNGDVSTWSTSKITDMRSMFGLASSFNGDVSLWDTSKVTRMDYMFDRTISFNNCDLSLWDTSNVTHMNFMFYSSSFNGDVSSWDVSRVTTMYQMFNQASKFNGDLSLWNTSQVTTMYQMFFLASSFNGNVSAWDTSQVTTVFEMFRGASNFDGDISAWDTGKVTDMRNMFFQSSLFNSDVSLWDTSQVTDMSNMFREATNFNSNLSLWDTSKVTSMQQMFFSATNFNSDISLWDTSRVETMFQMFHQATNFSSNLSLWNTSQVTSMYQMFDEATSFNGDISNWDISKVISISYMFSDATQFQQNLCPWRLIDNNIDYAGGYAIGLFVRTNCPNKTDPSPGIGPWCFTC